ncbi:MAG: GNAT family N-acetyltransferase [Lachnospiraceae bacterium]|nr:GNAT family N-acetyltransferase [Lachnospiraceae bacterium]
MLIENVYLFITEYNEGDSPDDAKCHIGDMGLCCFDKRADIEALKKKTPDDIVSGEISVHSFAITDDRETADVLKSFSIGFAVYDNEKSRESVFRDALYRVDNISCLNKEQIERFLRRYLRLPWTILETERCLVREMTEEDLPQLYEVYSGPDITRYTEGLYEDYEKELDYTREYIDKHYRFFEYGLWVVFEKQTGKMIGRAGLSERNGFDEAEIGYVIAQPFQRKGYAYEVLSAVLDYARKELSMKSVNAFTVKENTASVNLLDKLGFTYLGEIMIDGKPHQRYNILWL